MRASGRIASPIRTSKHWIHDVELDADGVPRLSSEMIERAAEEVIEEHDPRALETVTPTPIEHILRLLVLGGLLKVDFETTLGVDGSGRQLAGLFKFSPPTICIDPRIIATPKFLFTLAHEFGHFALHRHLRIRKRGYFDVDFGDTEEDMITGHKVLRTPRDFLEYQANKFASALLLPRRTFKAVVFLVQKQHGTADARALTLRIDEEQRDARDHAFKVLHSLRKIYRASLSSLLHRLADLDLLSGPDAERAEEVLFPALKGAARRGT